MPPGYLQDILQYHCLDVVLGIESKFVLHVTLQRFSALYHFSLEQFLQDQHNDKILMAITRGFLKTVYNLQCLLLCCSHIQKCHS